MNRLFILLMLCSACSSPSFSPVGKWRSHWNCNGAPSSTLHLKKNNVGTIQYCHDEPLEIEWTQEGDEMCLYILGSNICKEYSVLNNRHRTGFNWGDTEFTKL